MRVFIYLHECLRIISSPLVETPSLLKSTESWIRGYYRDPVGNVSTVPRIDLRDVPSINIGHNLCGLRLSVTPFKVVPNPCNEVIFECAFDDLM